MLHKIIRMMAIQYIGYFTILLREEIIGLERQMFIVWRKLVQVLLINVLLRVSLLRENTEVRLIIGRSVVCRCLELFMLEARQDNNFY